MRGASHQRHIYLHTSTSRAQVAFVNPREKPSRDHSELLPVKHDYAEGTDRGEGRRGEEWRQGEEVRKGREDNSGRSGEDEEVNHENRKCHNKTIAT